MYIKHTNDNIRMEKKSTIMITKSTIADLKKRKIYQMETYDEVLQRLLSATAVDKGINKSKA